MDREVHDSPSWTMVSPDQKFPCNGQVTEWRYQGKKSNGFQAIVWRRVDNSTTKFRVVGINDIPAGTANTPITFTVSKYQRITVKAGDMIGWSFGDPVLAFDYGGVHSVRWLGGNLHGNLQVFQERDINEGVEKREYSIVATIGMIGEPGE